MAKYILYDFRCCSCHKKFEQYVKPDVYLAPCPDCKEDGARCISAPTIRLPGTDPDFPREYDQWEKKQKAKQTGDAKFYEEHGTDKLHHSCGS